MQNQTNLLPETGFIRLPIVLKIYPVSKSTWWAGVKDGRFPQPIKLGPRVTAWRVEDIKALIEKGIDLAIKWSELLECHAKRIYNMATDVAVQTADALAKRIKKGELEDGFTLRYLYRKGWNNLNEKELAEIACDELVRLGWLGEEMSNSKNSSNKIRYRINPKITEKN